MLTGLKARISTIIKGEQAEITATEQPGNKLALDVSTDTSQLSLENSTTTPLGASGVFTGEAVDISNYVAATLQVFSDQASADDGISFQTSVDGTNWDHNHEYTYAELNMGLHYEFALMAKYFRLVYTNGAVAQTVFRLQTKILKTAAQDHVHSIEHEIDGDHPAKVVRAILSGKTPGDEYLNVDVNGVGALHVDSFIFAVARGNYEGISYENKYGYNDDVDSGSAPEDIWGPGGLYTGQPDHADAAETLDIYSSSTEDAAGGTGALTIRIEGLDENWNKQEEIITLTGTTPVVTTSLWRRMFRAKVLTTGSAGGNVGILTAEHSTTSANVFMQIPAGFNTTVIAAYTVPANHRLYMRKVRFSIARANGTAGSATVSCKVRAEGGPYVNSRYETITTSYPFLDEQDGADVIEEKTDIVLRTEAVSDNNTMVAGSFQFILVDLSLVSGDTI